jgi:hypothetical protein
MVFVGLKIGFLWSDYDVVEVSIHASNGAFCGTTKAYVSHGALAETASILEGFPRQISDARELVLGTLDPKFAGGGISMKFSCRDSAGHATVEMRIVSDASGQPWWNAPAQSVHMFANVEAAAIDDFVVELRRFETVQGALASLRFT